MHAPLEARGVKLPGLKVKGGCELPDMDVETKLGPLKSCVYCEPQSHFSTP